MKKLVVFILLMVAQKALLAQDVAENTTKKEQQKSRVENANASKIEAEEGTLNYTRQNGFGIELRTNGYGIFFEIGRKRTPRWTNTYSIELTEIKHPKEEKTGGSFFSSPFIYGKINNFYQAKLGFGQQYIFGEKGNKNGVAVIGLAQAGLSLGLLKPYYITVGGSGNTIKYSSEDSVLFLTYDPNNSAAGFTKGWNDVKLKPGAYVKAALRFDIGRFNESISAIEVGMSVDAYADKISILAPISTDVNSVGPQRFFFQGHIAFVFGRRK